MTLIDVQRCSDRALRTPFAFSAHAVLSHPLSPAWIPSFPACLDNSYLPCNYSGKPFLTPPAQIPHRPEAGGASPLPPSLSPSAVTVAPRLPLHIPQSLKPVSHPSWYPRHSAQPRGPTHQFVGEGTELNPMIQLLKMPVGGEVT